jgi:hypothetical protein
VASSLQQIRLQRRYLTSLVLTKILHLIAILLTLVAEDVGWIVVLCVGFLAAV